MTGQWQDLTLRTVTPAFLGRFDTTDPGRAEAPFPVPSLRGVLAYWLRALAGAHLGNETSLLHEVESAVFGSARTGHAGGPSPIQIRGRRILLTNDNPDQGRTGLRYLMGPGLTDAKRPPRYLRPGQIQLKVRNDGPPASADLFLAALWALRTFGGIGARSRRGFGTLAVADIPSLAPRRFDPAWLARDRAGDLEDILRCVAAAIGDLRITIPPATQPGPPAYPCFAPGRYRVSADDEDQLPGTKDNWADALDQAGELLRGFRHGGNRRIPGPQPRVGTHSQAYTDVAQPFLNGGTPRKPAIAAALGLPIPYTDHQGRQGAQRKATIEVRIGGVPARRASPLWLRVRHDGSAWHLRSLAFHDEWLPPPPAAQLRITSPARSASVTTPSTTVPRSGSTRITSPARSASVTRPADGQIRAELTRWFDG